MTGGPIPTLASDVSAFESINGLGQTPIRVETIPGSDSITTIGNGTVGLAIGDESETFASAAESLLYFSRGAQSLTIYNASGVSSSSIIQLVEQFAADDTAEVGLLPFGTCEPLLHEDGTMATVDALLLETLLQGQTVFTATGDNGALCGVVDNPPQVTVSSPTTLPAPVASSIPTVTTQGATLPILSYPASSPYAVAVGGTTLLTTTAGSYYADVAWRGTVGGNSLYEQPPFWQRVSAANNGRAVPDLAFVGDPQTGINFTVKGQNVVLGGTAIAAGIAAGIYARIDDENNEACGNAGPVLYGHFLNYPTPSLNLPYARTGSFRDVQLGAATVGVASPGFDTATGMGSVDVNSLLAETYGC